MAGKLERSRAMRTLLVDLRAGEASRAMAEAGVAALLLKGRTHERWLYSSGEIRVYSDVDLLVAPEDRSRAETVLRRLGYEPVAHEMPKPHARTWKRPGEVPLIPVDLHTSFHYVTAESAEAVAALGEDPETITLGGQTVPTLGPAARAAVLVLHFAVNGLDHARAVDELDRALARTTDETWSEAAELAERLGAAGAFNASLRARPAGAEVADRLGLSAPMTSALWLDVHGGSATGHGFRLLAEARGPRRRAWVVARELVPPREQMREHHKLARRGPLGLAVTYAVRPLWLARHAPAGLAEWRRARRFARGGPRA